MPKRDVYDPSHWAHRAPSASLGCESKHRALENLCSNASTVKSGSGSRPPINQEATKVFISKPWLGGIRKNVLGWVHYIVSPGHQTPPFRRRPLRPTHRRGRYVRPRLTCNRNAHQLLVLVRCGCKAVSRLSSRGSITVTSSSEQAGQEA